MTSTRMGPFLMLAAVALFVAASPSQVEAMPLASSSASGAAVPPASVSSFSRRGSDSMQDYLSALVQQVAAAHGASWSSQEDIDSNLGTSQQNHARSKYVSNVHPLSRRSPVTGGSADAALGRRGQLQFDVATPYEDDDEDASYRSDANVRSATPFHKIVPGEMPGLLAARAPAPPQVIPVDSAAAPTLAPAVNNVAAASPSPASSPSSDDSKQTDDNKSSDAKPTASSQPSSSPSPSDSPLPSSSSGNLPSPTSSPDDKDKKNDDSAITSPHNKLFPLFIAGVIAGGLLGFMVLIAIAKEIAHACMRRDDRRGISRSNTIPKIGANGAGGAGGKRSGTLRRAVTRTLGSFARRNRQGSVLIDVGDEVLAVPPEVAEEYERERKSVISGGHSSGSSSGGGLTWDGRTASPLRVALRNAELAAAAKMQKTITEEDEGNFEQKATRTDGAETRRKPDVLDINQWRATLEGQQHGQHRPLILGQKQLQQQQQQQQHANGGLARTLSQRLVDSLKALRGAGSQESLASMYKSDESKQSRKDDDYNFDAEKHAPDARDYMPVIVRGSGGGWDVKPSQPQRQTRTSTQAPRRKDTVRIPGGFPSSEEEVGEGALQLQRGRRDATVGAYKHRQQPHSNGRHTADRSQRNTSRAPRGGAEKIQTVAKGTDAAARRVKPSSTAMASPKMFERRSGLEDADKQRASSKAFVGPAFPEKVQSKATMGGEGRRTPPRFRAEENGQRQQAQSGQTTRELFRPLPLPPAFSPLTGP